MFWRRKSEISDNTVFTVHHHAAKLGIERRRHVRVRYPMQGLTALPSIEFRGQQLSAFDISEGGLCILDPEDAMGPEAGQKVSITLRWPEAECLVDCRMVSRVHDRRHIQFLNLEENRIESIRNSILSGSRGLLMKPVLLERTTHGVALAAKELWTSINGDSVSFFNDVHVVADIHLNNVTYRIHKEGWPMIQEGPAASLFDLERLLIFVGNFPSPSRTVSELLLHLKSQRMTREK